jgi:hypothetical protein
VVWRAHFSPNRADAKVFDFSTVKPRLALVALVLAPVGRLRTGQLAGSLRRVSRAGLPGDADLAAGSRAGYRPAAGQQHGVIMVAGQKIALGRIHAGQVVTVHVAAGTITIDLAGEDTRTVRRTTTQPVRSIKAQQHRKAAHVS